MPGNSWQKKIDGFLMSMPRLPIWNVEFEKPRRLDPILLTLNIFKLHQDDA